MKKNQSFLAHSALALACGAALVACGGGASTSTPQITGKVLDGYISGATVFWDCNANSLIDSGEVSTTSSAGGVYVIQAKPSDACKLTAIVPSTAIDEDTGTSVLSAYTMYATNSNTAIISPLTTLVALDTKSATQDVAREVLKAQLSISSPIDADYIASGNSDLRKFAKVTTRILQSNSTTNSGGYADSVHVNAVSILTTSASTIRTASVNDILNNKISLLSDSFNAALSGFLLDKSLTVQINPNGLTAVQKSYLNDMLLDESIKGAIANGQINWSQLPFSKLESTYIGLKNVGIVSPNASYVIDNELVATKKMLDDKFLSSLNSNNQFISIEWASLWPLLDIGTDFARGAYGAAKMTPVIGRASASARRAFSIMTGTKITVNANHVKKIVGNLKKLSRLTGLMATCGNPIYSLRDIFVDDTKTQFDESDIVTVFKASVGIVGCLGDLVDSDGLKFAVSTIGAGTAEDPAEAIAAILEILQIFSDVFPPNDVTNTISGFVDVMNAGIDAYKQGQALSQLADRKLKIAISDLQTKLDNEKNLARLFAYKRLLREALEDRIVRGDIKISSSVPTAIQVRPIAFQNINNGSTIYQTGIVAWIPRSTTYDSATVSGPGITGTAALTDTGAGTTLQNSGYGDVIQFGSNFTAGTAPAGTPYTVKLYKQGSQVGSSQVFTLASAVLATTELNSPMFPFMRLTTYADLCPGGGKTTASYYTIPSALPNSPQASLTCTSTSATAEVEAFDTNARSFVTVFSVSTFPTVTGITAPSTPKVGVNATFSINGTNLPTTENLVITPTGVGCTGFGYGTRSTVAHTFACTPSAAGTLTFAISTAGGMSLGSRDVQVSSSTYTLGQSVIDLGTNGKLIAPYQLNGKWYYAWDADGNGVHNWDDVTITQYFDTIAAFLKYNSYYQYVGGGVDEANRFGYINSVRISLPGITELKSIKTANSGNMPAGWLWGSWAAGINYGSSVYWTSSGGNGVHVGLTLGSDAADTYGINDVCCRNWASPVVAVEVLPP